MHLTRKAHTMVINNQLSLVIRIEAIRGGIVGHGI
jgi:hypothetical protein